METRTVEERLKTIDCGWKNECVEYGSTKCLECARNRDVPKSFFVHQGIYQCLAYVVGPNAIK